MDIIQAARYLAWKEIRKFGVPEPISFALAEKKAEELASKLGANRTITLVGYNLMDLKLGEAFESHRLQDHVKMSLVATRPFLNKFRIPSEDKKKILNCIEAHHGDVPFICKEAEICANADAYRFLHPRGFLAMFSFLSKKMDVDSSLRIMGKKIDEKYRMLSLAICRRELEPHYWQLKRLIRESLG